MTGQTQSEQIRAVFDWYGGRMTIRELVQHCCAAGIVNDSTKSTTLMSSMETSCRRALTEWLDPETGQRRMPHAVRLKGRSKEPR